MKRLHGVALVLGSTLFVALVSHVGIDVLWRGAAALGAGIVLIVAIEGIADFLHTCAWQRCFMPDHRPRILRLWGPHLAGAAINIVTPTATIGGEVVRGTLVPLEVPGSEATASLAINKLTATLSDMVLSLLGVAVMLALVPTSNETRVAIVAGVALFSAGGVGFLVVQRRGRLAALLGERRLLARVLGAQRAAHFARLAGEVDGRIARFHAERPRDLVASTLLHGLGALLGAVQLGLFLHWMDARADLRTIALVFLVARVIDLATFIVPARLGAQEGARMLAMRLAGLDPALGLLFSLVLRLEQLTWAGIGLTAYATLATGRNRGIRVSS